MCTKDELVIRVCRPPRGLRRAQRCLSCAPSALRTTRTGRGSSPPVRSHALSWLSTGQAQSQNHPPRRPALGPRGRGPALGAVAAWMEPGRPPPESGCCRGMWAAPPEEGVCSVWSPDLTKPGEGGGYAGRRHRAVLLGARDPCSWGGTPCHQPQRQGPWCVMCWGTLPWTPASLAALWGED